MLGLLLEERTLLFATVSTPLVLEAWARVLAHQMDRAFAWYMCTSLQYGFQIGFAGTVCLKSAKNNLVSAMEHPAVVSQYLAKELSLGCMLGHFHHSAPHPTIAHQPLWSHSKGPSGGQVVTNYGLVLPKGAQRKQWDLTFLVFTKSI